MKLAGVMSSRLKLFGQHHVPHPEKSFDFFNKVANLPREVESYQKTTPNQFPTFCELHRPREKTRILDDLTLIDDIQRGKNSDMRLIDADDGNSPVTTPIKEIVRNAINANKALITHPSPIIQNLGKNNLTLLAPVMKYLGISTTA